MEIIIWMLVWLVFSVISVNRLDKALRVYILDYEAKRPEILKTISIVMIWFAVTIGILLQVIN